MMHQYPEFGPGRITTLMVSLADVHAGVLECPGPVR